AAFGIDHTHDRSSVSQDLFGCDPPAVGALSDYHVHQYIGGAASRPGQRPNEFSCLGVEQNKPPARRALEDQLLAVGGPIRASHDKPGFERLIEPEALVIGGEDRAAAGDFPHRELVGYFLNSCGTQTVTDPARQALAVRAETHAVDAT